VSLKTVQGQGPRPRTTTLRFDHISDALVSLQWFRVPERIEYKTAVMVYIRFYMDWLHVTLDRSPASLICQVVALFVPPAQTVFTFHLSDCPRSAPEPSRLPDLASGTIYPRTSHLLKIYIYSVNG